VAAVAGYWFFGNDAPAPSAAPATLRPAAPAAQPVKPVNLATLKPKDEFQDCATCPRMIVIPAGSYERGGQEEELSKLGVPKDMAERHMPKHTVVIDRPLVLGRYKVTRREFAAFVREAGYKISKGCYWFDQGQWKFDAVRSWEDPRFPQTERDPVVCVNADDIQAYLAWLGKKTGRPYRLPSETEWEHATRGGTRTPYHWGEVVADVCLYGNIGDTAAKERLGWNESLPCRDNHVFTAPVGSFQPNPFGLYDMIGNAREMLADCRNQTYANAPRDAAAWRAGECSWRAVRGSFWLNNRPWRLWSGAREFVTAGSRNYGMGFRVALSMP
jgi:formylglycine-generating enzyme required for sulfatase activity